MSCFICSEKHFVSIANALKNALYGNTETSYAIEKALEIKRKDLLFEQMDEKVESFVAELNAENFRAYNSRYNENNEIESIDFKSSDYARLNELNLIKQLKCLYYQCAEDQEKSESFNKLEKLINNLQSEYIGNIPEYKELPWGID